MVFWNAVTLDITRCIPFKKFHFSFVSAKNNFPKALGIIKICFIKLEKNFVLCSVTIMDTIRLRLAELQTLL